MNTALANPEPTAARPALAIGEQIQAQAGRAVIALQRVAFAAYAVTVYVGTRREDDLCNSYPDELTARAVARGYTRLFRLEARP